MCEHSKLRKNGQTVMDPVYVNLGKNRTTQDAEHMAIVSPVDSVVIVL